jgi:UDP-N-acetylglucosamine diphosphorylase / glucose-1-phosphate thymidylyltransferase / UDP-N-acetylgalactosamine diphosphorylase / glucosamine-1-phosphate N-acetyltransferase / galactosamine-1-phosphate N-acetyltransferase
MKAVILAAGEGVRLLPITATRPKHLIKVGGKPILEHCLDAVKKGGITEAFIVTHYLSKAIRDYFGDGEKFGLKLNYVEQPSILGTGNAARVVEPFIDGNFALIYGDLLFSEDSLRQLIQMSETEQPDAAMAVVPVGKPENFGIVELEDDLRIKRIVEKPSPGETSSNLANAGLYIFNADIFKTIQRVKSSVRGEIELTDAISLMIKDKQTVYAAEIPGKDWLDIGQPWDLLEANTWVLKRMEHKVLGTIEEGAHLIGPVTVAQTARIRSGAYIEGPSVIDEGSDVGPNCYIRPCTSLGKNTRIGNACEIKNSIIMDRTHVGHLSYMGDSIIGEHCNLAAGTLIANLRFDDGHVKMMVKNRVVDTGRRKLGAILGDEVKTGINALLMPGVKVGQNTWIGPDYMVQRDIEADLVVRLDREACKRKKIGVT